VKRSSDRGGGIQVDIALMDESKTVCRLSGDLGKFDGFGIKVFVPTVLAWRAQHRPSDTRDLI